VAREELDGEVEDGGEEHGVEDHDGEDEDGGEELRAEDNGGREDAGGEDLTAMLLNAGVDCPKAPNAIAASGWVAEREYPTSVMKQTMPSMSTGMRVISQNSHFGM
jgi:hypothetical protein